MKLHVVGVVVASLIGVFGAVKPSAAQMSDATSQLLSGIMSSNPAAIRSAIGAGADINANTGDGRTPLIVAAMSTRPDAVKLLLENGADPRKTADDPSIGNALTAAFFAMNGIELTGRADEPDLRKHAAALEVLRLIAAKKPNFDLEVRRAMTSMTALMIASEAGAADAVQILLDAGANPNAMNAGKYTALDYAVDRAPGWSQATTANRAAVVRALLAAGAKKDRKGADGVLPIERAKRGGNQEIVALLSAR
jgi:protein DGCR14